MVTEQYEPTLPQPIRVQLDSITKTEWPSFSTSPNLREWATGRNPPTSGSSMDMGVWIAQISSGTTSTLSSLRTVISLPGWRKRLRRAVRNARRPFSTRATWERSIVRVPAPSWHSSTAETAILPMWGTVGPS